MPLVVEISCLQALGRNKAWFKMRKTQPRFSRSTIETASNSREPEDRESKAVEPTILPEPILLSSAHLQDLGPRSRGIVPRHHSCSELTITTARARSRSVLAGVPPHSPDTERDSAVSRPGLVRLRTLGGMQARFGFPRGKEAEKESGASAAGPASKHMHDKKDRSPRRLAETAREHCC